MTFLNRHRSRIRPVGPFAPSSLFFGGIPGAWYDPTDLSTMFQDSTGTTPVTAVEQPVGLILDKSQGLTLGAELVANGTFNSGITGWTNFLPARGTVSWNAAAQRLRVDNTTGTGDAYVWTNTAVTAGKTYKIEYNFYKIAGASGVSEAKLYWFNGVAGIGTYAQIATISNNLASFILTAPAGATSILIGSDVTQIWEIDNVSVRELAGNHASQSTAASRPTYRARYNMVEQSEAFNNAWWTKIDTTISSDAGVAPDGTTTADLMYPTTSGSDRFVWRTPATVGINGQSYTVSVYAKASGKSFLWFATLSGNTLSAQLAFFNLQTGQVTQVGAYFDAVTIQSVGSGWYRCTATKNVVASANLYPIFGVSNASGSSAVTTNGTDGILIWGAQLLTAADVTATGNAYQRIAAATVYDTAPVFRPYLAFDGMDDSLSTASIDFTSTSKISAFSGVTKSAESVGMIVELSASASANAGFYMAAFTSSQYGSQTGTAYFTPSPYAAPITNTYTTLFDLTQATQAGQVIPRLNGIVNQSGPGPGVSLTGPYGNFPLFIGRRNNASFPFNGRLYSLIVRGAASSVTEIADTELWVNARTGGF